VSHETVSWYVRQLDEELEPWRTRELGQVEFPYLFRPAAADPGSGGGTARRLRAERPVAAHAPRISQWGY